MTVIGGRIMASAKEFREYADECMERVKSAKSNRERRILLQMVEAWLEAAVKAERRQTNVRAANIVADSRRILVFSDN
jgi:hypothetical protein